MTNTKTISVQQGLNELKTLEARIDRGINNRSKWVAVKNSKNWVTKTLSPKTTKEEFIQDAVSSFDSVQDLIIYRHALKSAILKSNALTEVIIGKKKMTVAEAIDFKTNNSADYELVATLKRDYNNGVSEINREIEKIGSELEKRISSIGENDKDSDSYKALVELYTKQAEDKKPELIFPKIKAFDDFAKLIEAKEKELEDFENEVDLALTTSNVITMITIEW